MSSHFQFLKDENRLLKVSGSIALLLFATSFSYAFLVNPLIKSTKLTQCLEAVDKKKAEADKINTERTSSARLAYDQSQIDAGLEPTALGRLKASIGGGTASINIKAEYDECYRRYK